MSMQETMEDIPVLSLEPSTLALSICKVTFHRISICIVFILESVFIFAILSPPLLEDPWSSSGYSAMLGNSPHIGQPGSFSAINPQDRMVCANHLHFVHFRSFIIKLANVTCKEIM